MAEALLERSLNLPASLWWLCQAAAGPAAAGPAAVMAGVAGQYPAHSGTALLALCRVGSLFNNKASRCAQPHVQQAFPFPSTIASRLCCMPCCALLCLVQMDECF